MSKSTKTSSGHPSKSRIRSRWLWAVVLIITAAELGACAPAAPCRTEPMGGSSTILDWSGWNAAQVIQIDGLKPVNSNRAELSPGKHEIRYGGEIGTSFLLNPKMSDKYDYSASVDMRAGHTYKVKHERTYGFGSYRDYFWIEDVKTGEIVSGEIPGHHRKKAERSQHAIADRETKDHFEALSVSALCDDAGAQYDVGFYYLTGIEPVGEQDLVNAYAWYSLAASNQYSDAQKVKDRIGKDMTPAQIKEAEYQIADLQLRIKNCRTSITVLP